MTNTAQAIRNHLANGSTADLAASLLMLDAIAEADRPDHIKRAIAETVWELEGRFPEVCTAVLAWVDDLETDLSMAEVAVAAIPAGAI